VAKEANAAMKHVVQFSGGLCSFWAAHRVIQRYGRESVTLLFADTRMEDEDLYRFNEDAEKVLGVPITRLSDRRSVWDLFDQKGMLGNSRFPLCSVILKREVLDAWRFANTTPQSHVFHLGLDWTEGHRMDGVAGKPGMVAVFKPWTVTAPMMEEPIWDKCRMQREWVALGYKLPRLYEMGFPHNNCGGFCVKAGQAHFAHLLKVLPDRFAFHEGKEQAMRERTGKDYSILNDRRGDGKKKTLTLRMLRERIEAGESFDRHDWGGCGCATI
jgi:hypothetical protein